MSSPASLDTYQQVFALSMLSNRASPFTGPAALLQQQLQYELSFFLSGTGVTTQSNGGFVPDNFSPLPGLLPGIQSLIGNWTLEWGPAVFSNSNSGVADNALFIASCPSVTFPGCPDGPLNTYVVAIAATNPISKYDWMIEDFTVSSAVAWDGWQPGNLTPISSTLPITQSAISMGTAIGVTQLLQLTPPASAPGSGTTITQFLSQLKPAAPSAVVFTGHSLAGALSPTTAFYLQSNNYLSNFTYQLTYPTAGATPGNAAFVSAFNSAFPSIPVQPSTGKKWRPLPTQPYQAWNTLLWNQYDVVPHAWFPLTVGLSPKLSEIPTLYGSPALQGVTVLQDIAIANSLASKTLYMHTRNQSLPGVLQDGVAVNGTYYPTPQPPTNMLQFLAQLYVQHIGMYSGIAAADTQPPINASAGVVLPAPLPQPSPKPTPLPGVGTLALDLQAVAASLEQAIANWLKNHHLS